MQKKTLLALALLCAAPPARADILIPAGGASNITIGSTTVTGTAGLLYSDGTYLQSLPGTFYATDPNWSYNQGSVFAFGNDQNLALRTDKSYQTAPLTITNTNTAGGVANLFEIYQSIGGTLNVVDYFDSGGDYFSRLSMTVSGHVGGTSPHQSIQVPTYYIPYMYAGWSDVTGAAFLARDNAGIAGEYSFMGMTSGGVTTLALDARDTQIVFGSQTVGSGQTFAGDTFFGRAAAATFVFGGADAAAPIAQTIGVQNVLAGTSNTAGANTIFDASMGTGTRASGAFEFFTAPAGSSGTSHNALSLAVTIGAGPAVTIGQGGNATPQLAFAPNSGNGSAFGSANSGGELIVFAAGSGMVGPWAEEAGFSTNGVTVPNNSGLLFSYNGTQVTTTNWSALWQCAAATSSNAMLCVGNATRQDYSGTLKLTSLITAPLTYATLPASPTAGQRAYIADGNTTTYYATVSSGGGSSQISVLYNGTNWIVD